MSRRRIGFWYRLAAVIAKPPLVVLFKRDWRGMEHIPADGGFITAVNHNSYLDPLSYGTSSTTPAGCRDSSPRRASSRLPLSG